MDQSMTSVTDDLQQFPKAENTEVFAHQIEVEARSVVHLIYLYEYINDAAFQK